VGPGWDCLELGGGNGSVAEWLSGRVGPTGTVTAIDINPVLLDLVPAQNITVQQADIRTAEIAPSTYDLVSCRALLHQISEHASDVLEKMAAAVKPGGWLLIQEPDFHLAPTTEPQSWSETWSGLIRWGHDNGVDWLIGRRMPSMVSRLGLGRPQAKTDMQNIRGPICRTSVERTVERCTSSFSSLRSATGWWPVERSTRAPSMRRRHCLTIRNIGPSAG